jgi:uracil-DNA glycosylase
MKRFKEQLHSTWRDVLEPYIDQLEAIEEKLTGVPFAPEHQSVLRAFETPIDELKVLIIGQDPYPNPDFAMGLAFSVAPHITKLPASLKNIFIEYQQDTGFQAPKNGDLSCWSRQGVMLLNRTLTLSPRLSNSHEDIGWKEFTFNVSRILSERNIVAILWGSQAQELADLFPNKIVSVHPSPLSAYRGFFGSKPFTRANAKLAELGISEVDWDLSK